MASPEYHEDLSLIGRMKETLMGTMQGMKHGAEMVSLIDPHRERTVSDPQGSFSQINASKKERDLPFYKGVTGQGTYIYEQATMDGNSLGHLRVISRAKARDQQLINDT